jgi:simple sugar transport system permease protein
MRAGSGQSTRLTRPSGIVILGEAARRFMLRPETTALAAVIALFIIFSILSPGLFPTKETYISVMSVAAELGILSIGVTLLMIGGHFDLSVGAVLGLTSYVAVALMRDYRLPPIVAGPAAVGAGAALGVLNGAIVVRFRIHSFVVTLGTMLIWRGVLIALTGGFPMTVTIPPGFKAIMASQLLDGFRMSMLWFLVIDALGTFLLLRTRFGNWIQARGQNEQAARNLGVPVDRTTVALFALTSALAAVVGIIQVARFSSVDALRGEGMELQAVAVTVIGGTLLSQRYRHPSRCRNVRHDPGRPRSGRRAGTLLSDPYRLDRGRRGHTKYRCRAPDGAVAAAPWLLPRKRRGRRGNLGRNTSVCSQRAARRRDRECYLPTTDGPGRRPLRS